MRLNGMIDHTNLHPEATEDDIARLCDEAAEHYFHSVAINSCWTGFAAARLKGTGVAVDPCVGFPLGACSTAAKAAEARQAVADGADELDMVINVGRLRMGDDAYVVRDVRAVVEAAQGRPVKAIIECCLLSDEEKVRACKDCVAAGVAFVKTSTGFSTGGATVEDVRLMRATVGDACGVKAAGGIHTREEAEALVEAGASRIGASAGIAICKE